jgi:hypothetical protein
MKFMRKNINRTKKQKRGGNNIPLITYTPDYKSLDFTSKLISAQSKPWNYSTPYDTKNIEINIKFPKAIEHYVDRPPEEITILFGLNKNSEHDIIFKNFSIVFCTLIKKMPNNYHLSGGPRIELIAIDNCGNRYHIQAQLQPGTSIQGYGHYINTTASQTYYYTHIGPNTKILPDTMIDFLIDNEIKMLGPQSQSISGFVVNYIHIPSKPNLDIKPHRKFEPTAELSDYIHQLETKHNSINKNVQTNINAKENFSQQANLNTEERWKELCKSYTGAKTQKNKNKASEKMTNLFNRLVGTN